MREPNDDYSATHYERPNQPWICGLAGSGHSCPSGPSARGRCPAMAQCAPVRSGDRWECSRSQSRGGPCESGPTPEGGCGCVFACHPKRSLRAIRGRFVRACTVLVIGVALLGISTNWRDRAIAPGPLARQHAQLMERSGEPANCAACHAAATQNIGGWMTSLVANRGHESQSQLCMKCHSKSISQDLSLSPHNVPAQWLRQVSEGKISLAAETQDRSVACSACHREHHGADFKLADLSNSACQSCHQQRFESFATDHPDFGIWPYERRTRIAFNHASHRDKHFAEKKEAFSCATCHTEDSADKAQLTASYEATCAKCHDEKISTSVARGTPMFALPTLDTTAMKAAGFDAGVWPKAATGDFDGRLPAVMKLLLAADPAAAAALTKLGPNFDFQDVDSKERVQLESVAAIAAATRTLSADLAESADAAIRERLQKVLGRPISVTQARTLAGGLSTDTARPAADSWFPGAKSARPATAPLSALSTNDTRAATLKNQQPLALAPAGNWSRDEASFSIRYTPAAHADPVLTTWLSVLADTPDLDQRPVPAGVFKELTKSNAPGLCATCHSVERTGQNQLVINWRACDQPTRPRGFTKFSHGPHLLIPQLSDCAHCHTIDSKAASAAAYNDVNPAQFVSDFAPVSKHRCTVCHTSQAAGDSCQKCHNYHVEQMPPLRQKREPLRSASRELLFEAH